MKKNIFIIDDSALMRRVLSDIINSDERFHAAEFAANGLEAMYIMKNRAEKFDAVLLDITMPRMNGIEFLAELKKQKIKATVIIVSTIARQDAKETIKALELGAFDFVTKPESFAEVNSNKFSKRLLECLSEATKAIQMPEIITAFALAAAAENGKERVRKRKAQARNQNANKLVAIACSTGGPKALHTVIPALPANLDAAVLVVQHMPVGFTKSLADRLNELSPIQVKEAQDGDLLEKGTVYIAKGGYQMRLQQKEDGAYALSVSKEAARRGLLPCADIMYESLSDMAFDQITCVVLTGMGSDGTAGISKLYKSQNIYVIAQDEETSVVYGMPKVMKETGLVDEVLPLQDISGAIIKNVGVH
ncbi:MAG: chemotaxis-specific protein-glutamate methyltransferase CheB [Lachnospiraceae bacterium]|jgi:two-component system chemotaxis response regulator CheB|nr:chemotaxis-specific protein-glutamate methyltransferase CheB [Lachnospiraceae bacterium]